MLEKEPLIVALNHLTGRKLADAINSVHTVGRPKRVEESKPNDILFERSEYSPPTFSVVVRLLVLFAY